MNDDGIAWDAFVAGADLPAHADLLSAPLGGSQRDAVEAVLARDTDRLDRLLAGDRALVTTIADGHGLLEIAVATGDPAVVEAVLAHAPPLDGAGDGAPLLLALHARAPEIAYVLLRAGASPTPADAPLEPFRSVIALGSPAGLRLLLDFGADPNAVGPLGRRPLHVALDMEKFTLAEALIAAGADLWAVDAGGGNLGTAVTTAMVTDDAAERVAQQRLSQRALAAGWPDPVPTPHEVAAALAAGRWPPRRG